MEKVNMVVAPEVKARSNQVRSRVGSGQVAYRSIWELMTITMVNSS